MISEVSTLWWFNLTFVVERLLFNLYCNQTEPGVLIIFYYSFICCHLWDLLCNFFCKFMGSYAKGFRTTYNYKLQFHESYLLEHLYMIYSTKTAIELLTHTCTFQNLGLETVGVEMDKNGAIQVLYSVATISFSSSRFMFVTNTECVVRLMNTPALQFHQSGLLEMLQIE